ERATAQSMGARVVAGATACTVEQDAPALQASPPRQWPKEVLWNDEVAVPQQLAHALDVGRLVHHVVVRDDDVREGGHRNARQDSVHLAVEKPPAPVDGHMPTETSPR